VDYPSSQLIDTALQKKDERIDTNGSCSLWNFVEGDSVFSFKGPRKDRAHSSTGILFVNEHRRFPFPPFARKGSWTFTQSWIISGNSKLPKLAAAASQCSKGWRKLVGCFVFFDLFCKNVRRLFRHFSCVLTRACARRDWPKAHQEAREKEFFIVKRCSLQVVSDNGKELRGRPSRRLSEGRLFLPWMTVLGRLMAREKRREKMPLSFQENLEAFWTTGLLPLHIRKQRALRKAVLSATINAFQARSLSVPAHFQRRMDLNWFFASRVWGLIIPLIWHFAFFFHFERERAVLYWASIGAGGKGERSVRHLRAHLCPPGRDLVIYSEDLGLVQSSALKIDNAPWSKTPSLARLLSPDERVPSLCDGGFIVGRRASLRTDIPREHGGGFNGHTKFYGPSWEVTKSNRFAQVHRQSTKEMPKPTNIGPKPWGTMLGLFVLEPNSRKRKEKETSIATVAVGRTLPFRVSNFLVGKGYLNRPDLTKERKVLWTFRVQYQSIQNRRGGGIYTTALHRRQLFFFSSSSGE